MGWLHRTFDYGGKFAAQRFGVYLVAGRGGKVLERHPRVGYMLACALDNAAYRSFNDQIRLQRTSTLMEGGSECDFRVYALP